MLPTTQLQANRRLITDMMRGIATIKPAVVTKVDGTLINAKPLTKTKYKVGLQEPFPEVFNIPLLIYSGGGSYISMPVKTGDTVLLFFSDRDTGLLLDTNIQPNNEPFEAQFIDPLKYYPVAAMPCFYTRADSLQGDPSKVKIVNGSSEVTIAPGGDIEVTSGSNVNITSSGNVAVEASGTVDVTGTLINLNGG